MNNLDIVQNFKRYPNTHPSSFFISFEGIEGAGKTTQIENAKFFFKNKGYKVSQFREPGGTKIGEALRSAILNSNEKLNPLTEAHIFCAARCELIEKLVIPQLIKPNHVVILDRFIDSSLAYQGVARELGIKTILELHNHAPLNTVPDLTFFLDIDIETSLERQNKRGNNKDYFEKESNNFYQKLITGFKELQRLFPERIIPIDACSSEESVATQIRLKLNELING